MPQDRPILHRFGRRQRLEESTRQNMSAYSTSEYAELDAQIASLTEQNNGLRDRIDELREHLEIQIVELKTRLEAALKEKQKFEEHNRDQSAALQAYRQTTIELNRRVAQLTNENGQLQRNIMQLTNERQQIFH